MIRRILKGHLFENDGPCSGQYISANLWKFTLMKMLKAVLEVLHVAINKKKKLNAYDWKERKVSLFTDDMIVYIANSKESIKEKENS